VKSQPPGIARFYFFKGVLGSEAKVFTLLEKGVFIVATQRESKININLKSSAGNKVSCGVIIGEFKNKDAKKILQILSCFRKGMNVTRF